MVATRHESRMCDCLAKHPNLDHPFPCLAITMWGFFLTWRSTSNSYKAQTKKEETLFLADYRNSIGDGRERDCGGCKMSRISIGEIAGRKMALAPPAGRYPHSFLSIEAGSRPDCLQVGGMVNTCLQCAYKSQRQRKRESQLAPQLPDISWLGDRDSNPDKRSQSPLSCR